MDHTPEKVKPLYWKLLFVLAIFTALAWIAVWQLRPETALRINFYDIGQGDAAFIKTLGGARVIIDGGPGGRVLQKVASDLPFFDRRIDLAILSHPHADHVAGLIEILRRYDVKRIMYLPIDFKSDYMQELLKLVEEKKVQKIIARPGQTVVLDKYTVLRILGPVGPAPAGKVNDPNDYSIIGRLSFGRSDFLFVGDAGTKEMAEIRQNDVFETEVLKIGHHGSADATDEEVLRKVGPQLAVISAGKNNQYNLPNPDVLKILDSLDIRYLRTDQDGDIRLISRGQVVKILRTGFFFGSESPIR